MNMHRKEIDAVMTKQPFFPVWLAGTMHPTRTPGTKRVRCTRQRSQIQVAESLQKTRVCNKNKGSCKLCSWCDRSHQCTKDS